MSGLQTSSLERAAAIALGYENTQTAGSNLPQRIAVFTPIATSKISGFTDWSKRHTVTSLKDFYDLFGVCPGLQAMRILKPINGGGVGSIPVDVFPIADAEGATSVAGDITPTGTADASATHTILFNGRDNLDGYKASYVVAVGDNAAAIVAKQIAAINAVLHSPVTATDGTTKTIVTAKWKGATVAEVVLSIDTGEDDCAIAYAFTQPTGVGASVLTTALANFGTTWTTLVLNPFGSASFAALATANGIPNPTTGGSGRWLSTVAKPFVAVTGTNENTIATLKALCASLKTDLTNQLAVAPNCPAYSWEIAANDIVLRAVIANDNPHMDINNMSYPDLPAPALDFIGDMEDWLVRNDLITNGVSTCTYTPSTGYVVQSSITFRRPDDQNPAAVDWRYVRDIMVDMNVLYTYKVKEAQYLMDKTIAGNNDIVTAVNVIKPKDWKALIFAMFDDLSKRALITDVAYAKANTTVAISGTNPQRMVTVFYYKRTGIVRQSDTTAYAGFSFGG